MNAPASAVKPPSTQAQRINPDVCTCRATTYGFTNMLLPIMPPITIMVASKTPRLRARDGARVEISGALMPALLQPAG